jgi:hypothetical protein
MKNKKIALLGVFLVASAIFGSSLAFADDISATTTVSSYIDATYNFATVPFGELSADTLDNPATDQTTGVYNVTVDTNKDFKVSEIATTVFEDGAGHSFVIGNLKMQTKLDPADLDNNTALVVTSGSKLITNNIAYTETLNFHGYWLSIPAGQYANSYNATLTETYANV